MNERVHDCTSVALLIPQAACCGQRDILELLLDHATGLGDLAPSPPSPPPPPADARGRQPLHFAAAHGDYGAAQLLLARGADVNVSAGKAGWGCR